MPDEVVPSLAPALLTTPGEEEPAFNTSTRCLAGGVHAGAARQVLHLHRTYVLMDAAARGRLIQHETVS
jgi:hypothetical protein